MAAKYTYLAAKAYDYETALLDSNTRAGQLYMNDIIRQRTIGHINEDGEPITGEGLANVLAQLSANFDVLGPQLGFNNPMVETTWFSLREQLFRITSDAASDDDWQNVLEQCRVDNLWNLAEYRRFCKPPTSDESVQMPGLVIPFSSTVEYGRNFFDWPAGADPYYASEYFATKIRSLGVWFEDYDETVMSPTPYIYLIPAGMDIMRGPSGGDDNLRAWDVVEQVVPEPFPIVPDDFHQMSWLPMVDTVNEPFAQIRRFGRFRAIPCNNGVFNPDEMIPNTRLVGRSVWNTRWLMIIPSGSLFFSDSAPAEGVERFIYGPELFGGGSRTNDGVDDIKLFFKTYAYIGY